MLLFAEPTSWAGELPYVGSLAGLVLLVVGAEVLVRGAVWIALVLGMSRIAVGLTLVSIGTSLPELLVTLSAAGGDPADGRADIGMGNVLGSNVANVLLIVGATAAIRSIQVGVRWFELLYMLLLSALACVPFVTGGVDRWLAIVMVAVLVVFLFQLLARERAARKLMVDEPKPATTAAGWLVHVLMLVAGFAMLKYGADWLVDGASAIATEMGMMPGLIGVTIVAIGTSMPELVTSVIAALRGQPEICIGNVIGSNIFNIGAVLGGAGVLRPFAISDDPVLPMSLAFTVASAIAIVAVLRGMRGVTRTVGVLFLVAYAGFLACGVLLTPAVG